MAIIRRKVFIIALLSLLSLISLLGCDWEFEIVSAEIAGTPNRIIYIANVDTELDLSGLMRISTQRNGVVEEHSIEDWGSYWQGEKIYHGIDFTIPGVYEVELYYNSKDNQHASFDGDIELSYKFFVQVINVDTYTPLKEE